MKHTDTRATLALIDATLRLADKPLWQDPEFLSWEHGQVGSRAAHAYLDDAKATRYYRGPRHKNYATHEPVDPVGTFAISPMVLVAPDHNCDQLPDLADLCPEMSDESKAMRVRQTDYPAPDCITHGPLLLGPEPATP
jgi:hypothetical protein